MNIVLLSYSCIGHCTLPLRHDLFQRHDIPRIHPVRATAAGRHRDWPGGPGTCQFPLWALAAAAAVSGVHAGVWPELFAAGLVDDGVFRGLWCGPGLCGLCGGPHGGPTALVRSSGHLHGGLRGCIHGHRLCRTGAGGSAGGPGQRHLPPGGLHHPQPAGLGTPAGLCIQRPWPHRQPGLGCGAGVFCRTGSNPGLAQCLCGCRADVRVGSCPDGVAARSAQHPGGQTRPSGDCQRCCRARHGIHEVARGVVVFWLLFAVHDDAGRGAELFGFHSQGHARYQL